MDEKKSILAEFRHANPREKLAIVSDVLSVLGISAATLGGGALALSGDIHVENLMGILISVPLFLAGAAVLLAAVLLASKWLRFRLQNEPIYHGLLQFALWAAVASGVLLAAFFSYTILDSIPIVRVHQS